MIEKSLSKRYQCPATTIMFSRALRAGYAVLSYVLLALVRVGAGACGGTAETTLSGLPAGLAWLTPRFPRPRFVDCERAAGEGRAVEGVNGRLRRVTVRHLDEAKTP